jgi:hypothetical protein
LPGERLEVLLQTRPGPGLLREPPLVHGRWVVFQMWI